MKTRVTGLGGIFSKPRIQKQQKHGMANTSDCLSMSMGVPFGGTIKRATELPHSGRHLKTIPPILSQANNRLW